MIQNDLAANVKLSTINEQVHIIIYELTYIHIPPTTK